MGEPARFMVYTHNTDSPLIRALSLISPSHQQFVIRSENMLTVKIISLAANITEVSFTFIISGGFSKLLCYFSPELGLTLSKDTLEIHNLTTYKL